jgi:hypothetical protein
MYRALLCAYTRKKDIMLDIIGMQVNARINLNKGRVS